jgi:hypothetical protein
MDVGEAEWRCFSDWTAIVSSNGFVTALAWGEVTITATVSGVSETHNIVITPDHSETF